MLLAGIFIFLTVLVRAARGGSATWQPQLSHDSRNVKITADASGYAAKDAVARRDLLQKRYMAMVPDEQRRRWPESTISYCYESTAARGNLHRYLIAATNLWKMAGLVSPVYKYKEVADPGSSCTGHEDRHQILVISITPDEWSGQAAGSATVGVPALDDTNPGYEGPTMYINSELRAVEGKTRFVATIAHELGHVWGLYHEHQNPSFWEYPYSSRRGNVFGSNFHCARFKDYTAARDRIREKYPNNPALLEEKTTLMCRYQAFAQEYHFSGADYLAESISASMQWSSDIPRTGATNDHVDWESIMIYAGYDLLLKNDGSSFGENDKPSAKDIVGIKKMYDGPFASHDFPTLPSSTKSPFYTKWKDMIKGKLCKE
ncbi:hypothetical protein LX32DRAFT_636256 [Colletotrichum zoysiae]|uniref:Metalloprotease n=1 Tax=Colletotrichum zoysiae TaxID=1216348 RepID=A0AAD9HPA1_9PEZI|nr:hypothetical protein LX32DRAFT_636256 [Colletotrichum zoysiae]